MLLLLFAGSGFSALIYEVVWLQLLQLSIGSTAVSLGVLLGTFMGGMCLGGIALPRLVSERRHPLRVYAAVEMGIGVLGVAVLYLTPWAVRLYAAGAGSGFPEILLRGAVAAVCLLPPTVLMGATLPAIARWTEATRQGVSWLGFFYGGNIAGAVFGALLAGFYLLRVHDVAMATLTAAAINILAAAAALGLAAAAPGSPRAQPEQQGRAGRAPAAWPAYAAIGLSGLCALGAEVIWTRLLALILGGTVYTFSIILAVFLTGLGIGSAAGAFVTRKSERPRFALGCCQALLIGAVAWAAHAVARILPYWNLDAASAANLWAVFAFDLLRCVVAILPSASLWGASFPLALAWAAGRGGDSGRLVGRVYAANTLGAILGAVGFSLIAIPAAGTQAGQQWLIVLSAAAAMIAFAKKATALLPAAAAAILAWTLPPVPWEVIAYGRDVKAMASRRGSPLLVVEGINASFAVTRVDETRLFHVSGKVEASSGPNDMRLQRMLGHFPALIHRDPRSVLVVGCGAGVTAGSFVPHPDVARIVICEIEPRIPAAVAKYFDRENHGVIRDPRTKIVHDDARHHVFTTSEKFDIITSDPIHPWVRGAATLYTREYFELCRRHLNPGGVITQWVPLYQSTSDAVRSQLATFFEVFPDGVIWGNDTIFADGYDVVLMGQAGGVRIDADEIQRRLDRVDYAGVVHSLKEVGFGSANNLLETYAGSGPDLAEWLKFAEINRDCNLRLQYLAGMGANLQRATAIYEEMLRYRRPRFGQVRQ